MFHGVFEPSFLCRVSPLRRRVWCPASSRPCFPLMQIPRETLSHKSRSVVKFCDILSIRCFQLARVVSVCFSSVPWLRCLCTHPTRCRIAPGLGPLTSLFAFLVLRVSLILRIKTCLIVSDVSDVQRASQVSISELILSHPTLSRRDSRWRHRTSSDRHSGLIIQQNRFTPTVLQASDIGLWSTIR